MNSENKCLVFRTTLNNQQDVSKISDLFDNLRGLQDWSVDLEDWENVLRVEGVGITSEKVVEILDEKGFSAEELPV